MDFRNQSITDILMVLAEASGTSIIPDETVGGNASFYFTDSDFEESLGLFLSTYKLHYSRSGNVIRVSRIKSSYREDADLLTIQATDVEVESLIRSMARTIGKTILYDPLPRTTLSVDIRELPPAAALEIVTRRLNDFAVERKDSYFYVRRSPTEQRSPTAAPKTAISRNGETYSLSLERGRFLELLAELFRTGEREFSLLTRTDTQLENLYFSDRDFDSLLRLVLEQGNADYILQNGVYYILELQRRDIVKKLKQTIAVPLRYISAQEVPNLLPADLASGNVIKADRNTNTLFLTGTEEEIGPIRSFIDMVDRPLDGLRYEKFDIKYLRVKDVLAVIPQKMTPIVPTAIPESNSFVVLGSPEGLEVLRVYVQTIDKKNAGYPVRLRYIKTEELLKSMPPAISKEDIVDSGYPNLVFFIGPDEKRKLFLRELESIDRPKPQIRYELLVVQYQKSRELNSNRSLSFTSVPDLGEAVVMGNLTNILSLSFDVVSKFGYQFAADLSIQLGENIADIYADTTLNGLSGQEIKFQNTDTYRYQEFEVDADTGKVTRTGVTREITSGLIIGLSGWVSGDDMITMTVNATVSKQNAAAGTGTNTLPSTSERVINTQVRTPSGKPIVLSGLIKEDTNKNIQKIPILGDIPLLGRLFKNEIDSKEKTEIVIYIVPHIARDGDIDQPSSVRTERYYRTLVKGNAP